MSGKAVHTEQKSHEKETLELQQEREARRREGGREAPQHPEAPYRDRATGRVFIDKHRQRITAEQR